MVEARTTSLGLPRARPRVWGWRWSISAGSLTTPSAPSMPGPAGATLVNCTPPEIDRKPTPRRPAWWSTRTRTSSRKPRQGV